MEEKGKEEVLEKLKKENPGMKLYRADVPGVGLFVFRPQLMSDVKIATEAADKLVEEKINENGGYAAFDNLPLDERTKISREIEGIAGDISNEITLARCVLYPENFEELVKEDKVESGVIPLLLEKILEISGWVNVTVSEV